MDSIPHFGELCALFSPLAWSFAVILFRKTGETVPPLALNLFKNSIGLVLFAISIPVAQHFGMQEGAPEGVRWTDYALLMVSGMIGVGAADVLFLMCLNRLGAGRQAIVNTAYSPPIIILSAIFLGERLSALQVVGVCLILGAVWIVGRTRNAPGIKTPRVIVSGVLFGIGACLTQAVSIVMIKPFMLEYPLLWMTCWRLFGGWISNVAILPMMPRQRRGLRTLLDRKVWKVMMPAAFLGTYVSLLFWMAGFKFADASVAAALNQTATLFTFVLAAILLREPVTRRKLMGLGLGVAGVALVTLCAPDPGGEAPADPGREEVGWALPAPRAPELAFKEDARAPELTPVTPGARKP